MARVQSLCLACQSLASRCSAIKQHGLPCVVLIVTGIIGLKLTAT